MSDLLGRHSMRYRLPPLNSLRAFEAAARHVSFTQAADELCVTQGAVSRHIINLETYLGIKLFVRGHREVSLTPEGLTYYEWVRDAFIRLDEGTAQVAGDQSQRVLKVRSTPTLAVRWLIPRLGRFSARHPEIELQLSTWQVNFEPGDLQREDIDLSIGFGTGDWPGMVADRLFSESVTVVCSPRMPNGRQVPRTYQDIARHTLLYSMLRPKDWRQWLDAVGMEDMAIDGGLHFANSGLAYQAAIDGLGLAIAELAFVKDDLDAGRLVAPFSFQLRTGWCFYLACMEEKARQPKAAAFRRWLLDEASAFCQAMKLTEYSDPAGLVLP